MRVRWLWNAVAFFAAVLLTEALKGSLVDIGDEEDLNDHAAQGLLADAEKEASALGLTIDSHGHFVHQRKAPSPSPSRPAASGAAAAALLEEAAASSALMEEAESSSHASTAPKAKTEHDEAAEEHHTSREMAHSLASVETDTSSHHKGGPLMTFYCDGYCLACDNGIEWRITRNQPTERKIFKIFTFGVVAFAVSLLGPFLGMFGFMYLGAIAVIGISSVPLLFAGAAIGANHLLTSMHERACPVVGFEEKLPKNRKWLKGLTANWRQVWSKAPAEAKFSLNDLDFQELVLRLKMPNGTTYIHGDRADISEAVRTKAALACNLMTFNSKLWAGEPGSGAGKKKYSAKEMESMVVKECGKWLCAKSKVEKSWKMGWFKGKGCGGFRGSLGNWFR